MSKDDTSDPEATALGSAPAGPVTEQIGRYRLLSDAHLNSLHGGPEFESIVAAVKRRTGEE